MADGDACHASESESLAELVSSTCTRSGRTVHRRLSDVWIRVPSRTDVTVDQGWKLHVSATAAAVEAVLHRVLPILCDEDVTFKVIADPRSVQALNEGQHGPSQIGKCLTVYPRDDIQAVRIAAALDAATQGLRGPAVPSDRPLQPGSLVHYRYGSFGNRHIQTLLGSIEPAIRTPDGEDIPDVHVPYYQAPSWVEDPFVAAGIAEPISDEPALIANRFLKLSVMHQSARGAVYLAVDTVNLCRCVLKKARPHALVGVDGGDAQDRLRHEARILGHLGPRFLSPQLIEVVEDGGNLYLAMEDIEGLTFEHHVADMARRGILASEGDVIGWGKQLTQLLGAIHAQRVLYRDLKSSNLILTPAGVLRLIDFEISYYLEDGEPVRGIGTRGYCPPQQRRGSNERPAVTDDVYGVGALLYLAATGAEPSQAPDAYALLKRPIPLMNPAIGPPLQAVIARCLHPEPLRRFQTMADVHTALDAAHPPIIGSRESVQTGSASTSVRVIRTARRRYRDLAGELANSLAVDLRAFIEGDIQVARSRHVNDGIAGTVLALATIAGASGSRHHHEVLGDAARSLISSAPDAIAALPGLYVGEAGVAAALLRAGQALDDPDLTAAADARARWVARQPHLSPDLFHGTAGRLWLHLLVWRETGHRDHLADALRAGELLVQKSERTDDGGVRWTIPPGYGGLSGVAYIGRAHGAAGIADTLLDLFEATGDATFLDTANRAAVWIANRSIAVLPESNGVDWPVSDAEEVAAGPFWCHGATGIGEFFLHAAAVGAFDGAADFAIRAARTAAASGRWAGPTQCHGLAGNIEFVLDVAQTTRETWLWTEAASLAGLLESFALNRDGRVVWSCDVPESVSQGYMVGYGGIAACIFRLGDPKYRPRQLSRRAFARK